MHSVPACQDSMPHPPPIEADTGQEATGLRFGDQCHRPSPGVRGVQVLPHHLVPDIKTPGGNPEGQLNLGGLLQLIHLRLGQEHGPPRKRSFNGQRPLLLITNVEGCARHAREAQQHIVNDPTQPRCWPRHSRAPISHFEGWHQGETAGH